MPILHFRYLILIHQCLSLIQRTRFESGQETRLALGPTWLMLLMMSSCRRSKVGKEWALSRINPWTVIPFQYHPIPPKWEKAAVIFFVPGRCRAVQNSELTLWCFWSAECGFESHYWHSCPWVRYVIIIVLSFEWDIKLLVLHKRNRPYVLTSSSRHLGGKTVTKQSERTDLYALRTGLAMNHLLLAVWQGPTEMT